MNKIYDKLLLAVTVLLLAGGVFLYLQKSGQAPSVSAPSDVDVADNPYAAEPVPSAESTEANWPEPTAQTAGPEWVYDVFTPPEIYIDADGNFVPTGWKPTPPPPPFGVYLADIERKPYRLQLEGYIEEDRSDPSKTLLLMFDEEAQEQVRARPGDEKPEAEFEVLDFNIQRIRDDDNNIEVVAKATILDQRSGEEIVLIHGERRFDTGLTVRLRSEADPSYEKVLTEAPTEFEGPLGQYTLLEINLEESSVRVEKHASDEQEPETRTLSARSPATPSNASSQANQGGEASETNNADDSEDAVFDFNF